jgi:hypothetical protein
LSFSPEEQRSKWHSGGPKVVPGITIL